MMAERHRLRRLEMREARHHRVGMILRPRHQRALQASEPRLHNIDGVAHPHAKVGRDLILAAARGVQAPRRRANQFGEPRFGHHVNILKVEVHRHAMGFIFGGDRVEPAADRIGIRLVDDALPR